MKLNKSIIATLLCLISLHSVAKEGDLDQEVKISASSQEADIKNNQLIFNGPVIVTQGSIKINADELQAFSKGDDAAKTLVASGSPATYFQIMDDGRPAKASASEIHYELSTRTLTLIGEASLSQGGSRVTGSRIRYNIKQQKLLAESTGKGEDRVITVIQPETYKKSTQTNTTAQVELVPANNTDNATQLPAPQSHSDTENTPKEQQNEDQATPKTQPTPQEKTIVPVDTSVNKKADITVNKKVETLETKLLQLTSKREKLETQLTDLTDSKTNKDISSSEFDFKKINIQEQIDKITPQQKQLESQLSQLTPSTSQLKALSEKLINKADDLQTLTSQLTSPTHSELNATTQKTNTDTSAQKQEKE